MYAYPKILCSSILLYRLRGLVPLYTCEMEKQTGLHFRVSHII